MAVGMCITSRKRLASQNCQKSAAWSLVETGNAANLACAAVAAPSQPPTAASSAAIPDIRKCDSPGLHALPQRHERILIVALLTEQTGPYLQGRLLLSSWSSRNAMQSLPDRAAKQAAGRHGGLWTLQRVFNRPPVQRTCRLLCCRVQGGRPTGATEDAYSGQVHLLCMYESSATTAEVQTALPYLPSTASMQLEHPTPEDWTISTASPQPRSTNEGLPT